MTTPNPRQIGRPEAKPKQEPAKKPSEKAITDVKPPAKPVDKPEDSKKDEAPAIDWSSVPAAIEDTGVARGDTIDVMKEVPQVIRDAVEKSYAEYVKRYEAASPDEDGKKKVAPHWLVVTLPTEEVAKEYARLAKRYGRYRPANLGGQITVRGGQLNKDPKTVRFSAKTYENRPPRKGKDDITDK